MDAIDLLRGQQDDFINRLKTGYILESKIKGINSELTVISDLKGIDYFCFEMVKKYRVSTCKRITNEDGDIFRKNLIGKLGEEALKARLDSLVTEVDYNITNNGDDNVDFRFTSDSSLEGIQVKTRQGKYDQVQWSITENEVEKNSFLVCMLIQKPIKLKFGQSEYHIIFAGFLPTNLIKKETNKKVDKYHFKINELLYSGGLKPYINELFSLELIKKAVEILGHKKVEEIEIQIEIINSHWFFKP